MTTEEALSDFDTLASAVRGSHGALERKEQRYNFKYEALVTSYRNRVGRAKSEAEILAAFEEFLARLKDPHISLRLPLTSDDARSHSLPLLVMPVESTYIVVQLAQTSFPTGTIDIGEELISVDGVPVERIVDQNMKYVGIANELSARHVAAAYVTNRPPFLSTGLRDGAEVTLVLRNLAGQLHQLTLTWKASPKFLDSKIQLPVMGSATVQSAMAYVPMVERIAEAQLDKLGAAVPFFMTEQVKSALGITAQVEPSPAALAKFGVTAPVPSSSKFFAVKYSLGSKKVLLVRIPHYFPISPELSMRYLRALLDEQQPEVDALVVDQTHNPGGSLQIANQIVSLLAPHQVNGLVQALNADRQWIDSLGFSAQLVEAVSGNANDPYAQYLLSAAQLVDNAYSAGEPLSVPISFGLKPTITPDPSHWTKPLLVLVDELSVSCGDFVPLMLKAGGAGRLFGARTMGGGGNVELVAVLPNSKGALSVSRGLGTVYDPSGTYPEANFVEDNGVTPHVSHTHTLADFRAGYVGYVNAFNTELAKQLTP